MREWQNCSASCNRTGFQNSYQQQSAFASRRVQTSVWEGFYLSFFSINIYIMTQKRVAFRFAVLTRIKLKLQNHIDPQLGVGLREECPVLHTHTSLLVIGTPSWNETITILCIHSLVNWLHFFLNFEWLILTRLMYIVRIIYLLYTLLYG